MLALPFVRSRFSILPGYRVLLFYTLLYLFLIVLLPLSAAFIKSSQHGLAAIWHTVAQPRVLSAYRISFGCAFAAAVFNVFAGSLLAWVLVRYSFPGRKWLDAMVDLPFALPTAVAGIALTSLWASGGAFGSIANAFGIKVAFTPLGITLALIFVGLPFVVRTVQPVLQELEPEFEEAAATLGATRWQTARRVVLPAVLPAVLAGFTLALARAIGEYGSVVFIAGNMPNVSEIAPLLIITKLEQYDYVGATAVAVVMLLLSFALLLLVNAMQSRLRRARGGAH